MEFNPHVAIILLFVFVIHSHILTSINKKCFLKGLKEDASDRAKTLANLIYEDKISIEAVKEISRTESIATLKEVDIIIHAKGKFHKDAWSYDNNQESRDKLDTLYKYSNVISVELASRIDEGHPLYKRES